MFPNSTSISAGWTVFYPLHIELDELFLTQRTGVAYTIRTELTYNVALLVCPRTFELNISVGAGLCA